MQRNNSSFSAWTWAVAAWLIVLLIWLAQNGHGPNAGCCHGTNGASATPAAATGEAPAADAFNFVATGNDFSSNGDSSAIAWLPNAEKLRGLLSTGQDLRAQGDAANVVLSGIVDTDAMKQQIGTDVQAFFGASVTVDNQLVVKAPAQTAEAATEPPSAAKLYFNSGKTSLPADAATTLSPIVDWLKSHASDKAVLSGYHDPRGNQAFNEELAKNRAKAVREALKGSGIDESHIEMRKPQVADGGADLAEARRVEVSVEAM